MATEETTSTTVSRLNGPGYEKFLAPAALGLGILFIIGGIVLGISNSRKSQIANLPDYSPVYTTPEAMASTNPTTSPVASPAADVTASPTTDATANPIASPQSNPTTPTDNTNGNAAIANQPSQTQSAANENLGQVNSATQTRTQAQIAAPVATQNLPAYSPRQELPAFSPVAILSEYQPQYVSPTPKQTITVHLAVPGRSYDIEVKQNATALEAMQTARSLGLQFQTKSYSGLGEMITEINGQSDSNTQYWKYSVNGVFAQKGISSQILNEGDRIVWTLS